MGSVSLILRARLLLAPIFPYNNLSFEFISLILRDFSLSSRSFYLEKGTLALPLDKNPKNLRELSYENKQNKLKTQVSSY
jgi:hypothetical protein